MVGRPPLPVGTFGKVTFVEQASGSVQARARFGDYDGGVRLVSKVGPSWAAAERSLTFELTDRTAPNRGGGVSAGTRVRELADLWLEAPNAWSTGTERTYRSMVKTQIKPALGDLRLREVTAGVVSRALAAIAERSGHGAAKSSRSALSGMFRLAVRDGALSANTVVRVRGEGLTIQPRPKTEAGWRVIAVPAFATELMRRRAVRSGPIFTAPVAGVLRDPSNVSGDLRQLLDAFECEHCHETGYQLDDAGAFVLGHRNQRLRCDRGPWAWVTSHTFRKTVATRLDEAGLTPRQIADQLATPTRP